MDGRGRASRADEIEKCSKAVDMLLLDAKEDSSFLNYQYEMAINNLDGAIAIIDQIGNVKLINEYPLVYHPLIKASLSPGMSIFNVIPEHYVSVAKNIIKDILYHGNPITLDLNCKNSEGDLLCFEVKCKPFAKVEGLDRLILIEIRDITTQKIYRNKLESAARDISSLVENANAIIIETDSREYITRWNRLSTHLTGYSQNEVFAKKLSQLLFVGDGNTLFSKLLENVLAGNNLSNYELSVLAKDGRKLDFLINANPKKNASNQVVGISIIGQDITELIAYRNSLEKLVDLRTQKLISSNKKIKAQKAIVDRARKKSEKLLRNILPDKVADELKTKGKVRPRYYTQATVLFADLVGFSRVRDGLTPELVLKELNHIFIAFDKILEAHHLEKIKTMGDGYMAVGGIPEENDTNPIDAVNAALAMLDFIHALNRTNSAKGKVPWALRIGIHTGDLIAGVIGKKKFAYDVWGPTVNIASRMESEGLPDHINLSEYTSQLVRDTFKVGFRGEIEVKNMGKMKMFFVQSLHSIEIEPGEVES